jgi:ABC-type cobalamin transport system ATPase subunit
MTPPARRHPHDSTTPRPELARLRAALAGADKPTRKNHYLHQSKIDMAKEILNAQTETEALDGALDLLIYGEALARGTEEMEGEEYEDVLELAREIPPAESEK